MSIRLNKVIKECNVGLQPLVDILKKKGQKVSETHIEMLSDAQNELV